MLKRLTRMEPEPPWTFTSGMVAVAGMLAAMLIGTTIAELILGDGPTTPLTGWLIGTIVTFFFVLAMFQRRAAGHMEALRLGVIRTSLPIVTLLALGMAIAIDLLSQIITGDFWPSPELLGVFSIQPDNQLLIRADVGFVAWVLAFVFMVGLQPLAEEVIFRGILFPAARFILGAWSGLLMVAAVYAAAHLLAYLPSRQPDFTLLWYGLAVPFLDGLVIGGVRAYTGSTRAAIVAHAAFGLFAVLKALTLSG